MNETISISEFSLFLRPMPKADIDAAFEGVDTDKSGDLTELEFNFAYRKLMEDNYKKNYPNDTYDDGAMYLPSDEEDSKEGVERL